METPPIPQDVLKLSAMVAQNSTAARQLYARAAVVSQDARDPAPFIKLTEMSLGSTRVRVTIDLFTNQDNLDVTKLERMHNVKVRLHKGRIPPKYWAKVADDRQVFICGPGGFGDAAVDGLRSAGVPNTRIHREGFY
ncbi:hypothetical protein NQ176_g8997 [Zarea fungicola]|uniref:Uncharacterized protein n=1 Tax=Zarea fungicola TaxID=93591 RepID=A0ACC1MPR8_9HYPO|nr:hypothetical protein NQ176_g8997 [Lecanicillium fungicola]